MLTFDDAPWPGYASGSAMHQSAVLPHRDILKCKLSNKANDAGTARATQFRTKSDPSIYRSHSTNVFLNHAQMDPETV